MADPRAWNKLSRLSLRALYIRRRLKPSESNALKDFHLPYIIPQNDTE